MPVHQIVRTLANGDTVEALLADGPFLSRLWATVQGNQSDDRQAGEVPCVRAQSFG